MSKMQINFNLGSRGLTAEERAVVESAKDTFRSSLERHGKSVAGHVVFASKSNVAATPKAAAKPAPKSTVKASVSGSATWTSNKTAQTTRKY